MIVSPFPPLVSSHRGEKSHVQGHILQWQHILHQLMFHIER